MMTLILFGVVLTVGLLMYFFSKGKKQSTKGGQGGTPEEKPQDKTKPIYKND